MGLQSLNCPNCNAPLQVDDTQTTFFCNSCGSQIERDAESMQVHKIVDIAKLKEVELNRQVEERKRLEAAQQQSIAAGLNPESRMEVKDESLWIMTLGFMISGFLCAVSLILGILLAVITIIAYLFVHGHKQLCKLDAEIQNDLIFKNFDAATIKLYHLKPNRLFALIPPYRDHWEQEKKRLEDMIEQQKPAS